MVKRLQRLVKRLQKDWLNLFFILKMDLRSLSEYSSQEHQLEFDYQYDENDVNYRDHEWDFGNQHKEIEQLHQEDLKEGKMKVISAAELRKLSMRPKFDFKQVLEYINEQLLLASRKNTDHIVCSFTDISRNTVEQAMTYLVAQGFQVKVKVTLIEEEKYLCLIQW